MNPYVYSKKRGRKAQAAQEYQPSFGDLAKHIASATVGTAVAFAIIIFAAGSVASMTAIAYAEIGGELEPSPAVRMAMVKTHPLVLGDSTTVLPQVIIDDTALEALDPVGQVSAKSGGFDSVSGRWNFRLKYSMDSLPGGATLSIGNYIIKSGITESGSLETGSILKPDRSYRVTLWITDSSLGKLTLGRAIIKTGKAQASEDSQKLMTLCKSIKNEVLGQDNSSSAEKIMMCIVTKEGKTICPSQADCMQNMPGVSGEKSRQIAPIKLPLKGLPPS